jgi:hypothetical protein
MNIYNDLTFDELMELREKFAVVSKALGTWEKDGVTMTWHVTPSSEGPYMVPLLFDGEPKTRRVFDHKLQCELTLYLRCPDGYDDKIPNLWEELKSRGYKQISTEV